jgi:hypothetical protein
MARKIERIVWHTAAHGRDGQAFDTTAAQIDQWHRERGWSEIGYNVVIRFDGTIEQGRDPRKIPAGVAGINETTYHICFSGHGDIVPLTPQQLESGIQHTIEMLQKYKLTDKFLSEPDGLIVMGHREVNELVKRGFAPTPTTKTCPGRLVDMNLARLLMRQRLTVTPTPAYVYDSQSARELLQGLQQVYSAAARLKLPEEAMRSLNQFRKQPEVDDAIGRWRQEQGD